MKKVAVALTIAIAVAMLAPMVLTVSASLKGRSEALGAPLRIIPRLPTLDNYRQLFSYQPVSKSTEIDREKYNYPIGLWFLNSSIIAITGAVTSVGIGLMTAFGLSKYRFRGRRVVIALVVLSLVVPGQVVFVQRFVLCRTMGLFNSLWAVIVPGAASVGTIWFLMQYMKSIPEDFIDMGRLDGLGAYGLLRRVIFPMCVPAVAALTAMYLVGTWNDYLWPLVVLRRPNLYTIALGIREVVIQDAIINNALKNPGIGFAGAVLAMLPGIVLFLVFQKYFVTGMFARSMGGK